MKNNILVTGGSGFIGNQVVHELSAHRYDVTIVDRKINHWIVPGHIFEEDYLEHFLNKPDRTYDTIIHLAADHIVENSVTEPAKYYQNNVMKLKSMLDVMVERGIKNIIYSSSAAVYGKQGTDGLLTETLPYDTSNPYASTKIAGEMLIQDYAKAYGIRYVNFRYFNAAGADPHIRFGYIQRPATHVIPILCNRILEGKPFKIFGNDYSTRDGTCVRDYIHVDDLAKAHIKALEFLDAGNQNEAFNLGGGDYGVSVRELVRDASEIVGAAPVIEYAPRRAGDPSTLVASIKKARIMLQWAPKHTTQEAILHAWKWENKYKAMCEGKKHV